MSNKSNDPNPPDPETNIDEYRAHYNRKTLDERRAELVSFAVQQGVILMSNGTSYTGYCPIHNDTRPSFSIYGDGNRRWKCFACDRGGDIFDLCQALGLAESFRVAVQVVSRSLGMPLPAIGRAKDERKTVGPSSERTKPNSIRASTVELEENEAAYRLLARIELRDAIRESADSVSAISAELGIQIPVINRAARGKSGLGLVDGKLAYVYPHGLKVRNEPGHPNRFRWACGRAYEPWRMERVTEHTETVYLTEGESDALALLAAGVENDPSSVVVASPGTSFQAAWTSLFNGKKTIICFDFDTPGQRAAEKVAKLLTGHASSVLIVRP